MSQAEGIRTSRAPLMLSSTAGAWTWSCVSSWRPRAGCRHQSCPQTHRTRQPPLLCCRVPCTKHKCKKKKNSKCPEARFLHPLPHLSPPPPPHLPSVLITLVFKGNGTLAARWNLWKAWCGKTNVERVRCVCGWGVKERGGRCVCVCVCVCVWVRVCVWMYIHISLRAPTA